MLLPFSRSLLLHADGVTGALWAGSQAGQTELCAEQAGLGALGGLTSGMVPPGKKLWTAGLAQASHSLLSDEVLYLAGACNDNLILRAVNSTFPAG